MSACPDCGRTDACARCLIDARLADPHGSPEFRDGAKPCRTACQYIEEHDLINGAFVCQKEATT